MKYLIFPGMKYSLLFVWFIFATVIVLGSKIWHLFIILIFFIVGLICRLKPFRSKIKFTLRHLWDFEDAGYGSLICPVPIISYGLDDASFRKMKYSELYYFWKD